MCAPVLQTIIGTALTDKGFRLGLLNGSRRHILQTFPLTAGEIDIIMQIRADSLEQFADQLHQTFVADRDEPEPLPLVYRQRGLITKN